MAQNDIGIDLGTTTIIIAQEGTGVVLNQPSVVAVDTRKNSVLEVGDKALAMVGRTPNYISAIFPLKDGVISDHTMTRELICRFVNQVYSSHMVKPRVAVCVPAAITGIESDAVVEAVMAAGARQVYLIDEPIAAALGSGIDITQPDGRMIIDIGGGTTDIAVLSLGGKVKATSVRVAGNHYEIVDAEQIFRLADTRPFKTAGKHLSAPTVWGGIRKWTKSREEEWGQRAGHRWEEVEGITADCVRRIIAER